MKLSICIIGITCACLALSIKGRYVINVTDSLPLGIYLYVDSAPQKGSLVVFDLPSQNDFKILARARGYVQPGRKLLKKIVAMPGDYFFLPRSRSEDSKGRQIESIMPPWGITPDGMAIVLGQKSQSFDSRYYGPIPLSAMRVVEAVFTINNPKNEEKI